MSWGSSPVWGIVLKHDCSKVKVRTFIDLLPLQALTHLHQAIREKETDPRPHQNVNVGRMFVGDEEADHHNAPHHRYVLDLPV